MDDPIPDSAREAAATMITAKRDALVAERTLLLEQRAEILSRLRRIDRDLSDCRSAARLFELKIEFPPDEDDDERLYAMRRMREREMREREVAARAAETARVADAARAAEAAAAAIRNATAHKPGGGEPARPFGDPPPASAVTAAPAPEPPSSTPQPSRPTLREVVLDYLKRAGSAGSKAAPIRDFFERTYGEIIHEKTVGMTLYRLSKEGLVRRDGHTWFFVEPRPTGAETKNPGVVAPGLSN